MRMAPFPIQTIMKHISRRFLEISHLKRPFFIPYVLKSLHVVDVIYSKFEKQEHLFDVNVHFQNNIILSNTLS